ncbi:putative MFS transporter [Desulfitobacterium sp. LBE]|uniref:Benzoate transport protein n=4 Tax=root TaxID=1 RepID=A0A098B2K0_DESHA|nr:MULTISPECIES: MFS transporter [Desulfitobacterium]ACL21670.1 major facilitator superfamily MFS_1 [Desulfitobacterium hafniense DCB-2]EHL08711.1 transporter, major facilitator family protein [Desulfitobacterium hafniense DP7]MEA5024760.1 MFS transporter [Desulfitobacterium hafniense]TWH60549.1 putative MFS transporter [Desulfitobacterium sp. LBE]CDX02587.1 Benzoate transport protein [Desulfitobacterium hafniense]
MGKISISDVVDQIGVSKYTYKTYFLVGLTLIFCGFSYMIVSYTMPQMSAEWGLTKVQTGSLASWSLLGLMVGGMIAGIISDSIGRKKGLAIFTIWFSLLTFPIYFVNSFEAFAILRILGGVGFGACIPIAITLMAENVPTKNRGFFISSIMSFYVLGWVVAGVVAIYVVPTFGWRVCYLIGVLPVLYAFVLMAALQESPHWLLGKGREKEAIEVLKRIEMVSKGKANDYAPGSLFLPPRPKKVGVGALFSREYSRATMALWIIYFMGSVVIYGINGWLPTLLVDKGYGLVKGYSFAVLQNVFGAIGGLCTGYVADIIGRRTNVIIGWIATAVAILLLGVASNQWMVVICGMLVGLAMNWGLSGTQPLLAEGYPTEFRSTGVASAQAFGRVGGFLGPIVAGYVQQLGVGFTGTFVFFAVPAVIASFVALFFVVETKGKSIERISANA